jgi:hypothetical protein
MPLRGNRRRAMLLAGTALAGGLVSATALAGTANATLVVQPYPSSQPQVELWTPLPGTVSHPPAPHHHHYHPVPVPGPSFLPVPDREKVEAENRKLQEELDSNRGPNQDPELEKYYEAQQKALDEKEKHDNKWLEKHGK